MTLLPLVIVWVFIEVGYSGPVQLLYSTIGRWIVKVRSVIQCNGVLTHYAYLSKHSTVRLSITYGTYFWLEYFMPVALIIFCSSVYRLITLLE